MGDSMKSLYTRNMRVEDIPMLQRYHRELLAYDDPGFDLLLQMVTSETSICLALIAMHQDGTERFAGFATAPVCDLYGFFDAEVPNEDPQTAAMLLKLHRECMTLLLQDIYRHARNGRSKEVEGFVTPTLTSSTSDGNPSQEEGFGVNTATPPVLSTGPCGTMEGVVTPTLTSPVSNSSAICIDDICAGSDRAMEAERGETRILEAATIPDYSTGPGPEYFERVGLGYGNPLLVNVSSLGVLPEYRRCGGATALMESIYKKALTCRASAIFLHTPTSNTTAISFYHSVGFQSRVIVPGYYFGASLILEAQPLISTPPSNRGLAQPETQLAYPETDPTLPPAPETLNSLKSDPLDDKYSAVMMLMILKHQPSQASQSANLHSDIQDPSASDMSDVVRDEPADQAENEQPTTSLNGIWGLLRTGLSKLLNHLGGQRPKGQLDSRPNSSAPDCFDASENYPEKGELNEVDVRIKNVDRSSNTEQPGDDTEEFTSTSDINADDSAPKEVEVSMASVAPALLTLASTSQQVDSMIRKQCDRIQSGVDDFGKTAVSRSDIGERIPNVGDVKLQRLGDTSTERNITGEAIVEEVDVISKSVCAEFTPVSQSHSAASEEDCVLSLSSVSTSNQQLERKEIVRNVQSYNCAASGGHQILPVDGNLWVRTHTVNSLGLRNPRIFQSTNYGSQKLEVRSKAIYSHVNVIRPRSASLAQSNGHVGKFLRYSV